MEEFGVILKAREFVKRAGIDAAPVSLERYTEMVNATICVRYDLLDDESGQTLPRQGKHIIYVNGNHREERQRFTVLHEVAHVVLDLPSQHASGTLTTSTLMSYRRRAKEEVLCDVFAAECLLPYAFFKKDIADIDDIDISFEAVRLLAKKYKASLTCTGSRFAINFEGPCAFVLIESGKIRYVSSSKFMRDLKGWIDIGIPVPKHSVASRLISSDCVTDDYDEIASDIWFNNGLRGFEIVAEEVVRIPEWDQCLSLLWVDKNLQPKSAGVSRDLDEDEPLLEELDGRLPWPSKRRRK